jgi:hypothetical protein
MNDGASNPNAYIEIYTSPQPSSPIGAPLGVKLTTIYLPDPAVTGPSGNELTVLLGGLTAVVGADGKASWFRYYNKNGTTLFDGTVVLNSEVGDIKLSKVDLVNGDNIQISNAKFAFKCVTS